MSGYLVNGSDLIPVGSIFWSARNTVPPGYLTCNGSNVSRILYNKLFDAISVTYGSGDNVTSFTLPDLRGCFIRGHDSGRRLDFESEREFGSYQADDNKLHNHGITQSVHSHGASQDAHQHTGGAYHPWPDLNDVAEQNQSGSRESVTKFTDTNSVQPTVYIAGANANITINNTGSECRPKNIALLPIIKF